MKKYLLLSANYNLHVNKKVMEIISEMKEEDYQKDKGIYFKSVKGLFEHILVIDMKMFNFIKTFSKEKKFNNDEILDYTVNYDLKKEANKDLKTLFETREKMDNLIIKIIDSITDFEKSEEISDHTGKKYSKKRIQIIMHTLTHSVHHRGEMAALFDELGYKNDYSGLLNIEI